MIRPNWYKAMDNQQIAIEAWLSEIESRYRSDLRAMDITEVPLGR